MRTWVAVTFVTIGTPYEKEVERLVRSAADLFIPLVVYRVENKGNWRVNLCSKSEVILRAMDDHPGTDIVFVDADAAFREWPLLFDELSQDGTVDLAACFFEKSRLERWELLSGTLWIANTDRGRELVKAWDEYGRKDLLVRHQKALRIVLVRAEGKYRVFKLPDSYTRIFDHPGMRGVKPVIEHFQASRRFRRALVKKGGSR